MAKSFEKAKKIENAPVHQSRPPGLKFRPRLKPGITPGKPRLKTAVFDLKSGISKFRPSFAHSLNSPDQGSCGVAEIAGAEFIGKRSGNGNSEHERMFRQLNFHGQYNSCGNANYFGLLKFPRILRSCSKKASFSCENFRITRELSKPPAGVSFLPGRGIYPGMAVN